MSARALWLPYEVDDPVAVAATFTDHLGLTTVDGWDRGGSRGVVLRVADAAYLELATPGDGAPARVAVELTDRRAVDAAYHRWRPSPEPPRRHPRGHYGFDTDTAGGFRLMVWSEK